MILEVNNTFDERRVYFLKGTDLDNGVCGDENGDPTTGKLCLSGSQSQNPPAESVPGRFMNSWPKDFHVSPFNSRKGAYSLSASDPFFPHSKVSAAAFINNTITLSSSKQHPKLVARVFSSSHSIDPCKLDGWGIFKFIATWWWVGFVTFPRIVREAGKLFFQRKLHVWFRPEVLKDSIGRNETEDEKYIHGHPSSSQLLTVPQSHRRNFPRLPQRRCRKVRSSVPVAFSTRHRHHVRRRDLHAALPSRQGDPAATPCDFQDHFASLLRPSRPPYIYSGIRQGRPLKPRPQNGYVPYLSPGPPHPTSQRSRPRIATKAFSLDANKCDNEGSTSPTDLTAHPPPLATNPPPPTPPIPIPSLRAFRPRRLRRASVKNRRAKSARVQESRPQAAVERLRRLWYAGSDGRRDLGRQSLALLAVRRVF